MTKLIKERKIQNKENMKLNRALFMAILSLCAVNRLIAKQAKENVPGVAPQRADFFYTGKPYDADIGEYVFKNRNYSAELNRWASTDPSGFPDGANNWQYVTNSPLNSIDPNALAKLVAYVYANTGLQSTDSSSSNGAAFVQDLVTAHMAKFQKADSKNPALEYVNDGDKIEFGTIDDPNDLANFSNYDRIYLVAHGVVANNAFTGDVRINGTDYAASTITANNLFMFSYCGSGVVTPWNPAGLVVNWEVSSKWFWSVDPFFLE